MGGCQPIMKEQPVSSKKEMSDNIFNKIINSEGNGANNVPWQHNDTQDEKLRKVREELLGNIRKIDSSISQIKSDVSGLMDNYNLLYGEVEKVRKNVENIEIESTGNEMKISEVTEWMTTISSNIKTLFDTCASIDNKINALGKSATNRLLSDTMERGRKNAVLGCMSMATAMQRLRQQNVSDELACTNFLAKYFVKKGYILIKKGESRNNHNTYELVNCSNNPIHKNPSHRENRGGLCECYVIEKEYVIKELIPHFVKLQNHLDSFKGIGGELL